MLTSDVKFEASVCCMTYNQKDYIEDTMRGFIMQQTTFPFVCMVIDDASTDGEPEVLKHYLEENFDLTEHGGAKHEETDDYSAVLCRHKNNPNCYFAVYFLKYNHYQLDKHLQKMEYYSALVESVEYTGFCEGDDFWISPDFIQTSVDYLKSHNDYSAVFGNKLVSNEKGEVLKKVKFKGGLTIHDIMRGRNMGLRNLFFRKECLYVAPFETGFRDIEIYYFDREFAVYRITGKGVYSCLDKRKIVCNSYLHYYDFHKNTNFKYQKEYVNYQIRRLMGNLSNFSNFKYCCKLIKQFHVPSLKRYFWYLEFSVVFLYKRITDRIKR